jgi:hypothetical protein
MRRTLTCAIALLVVGIASAAMPSVRGGASSGSSAVDLLECAFENRYGREVAEILDVETKVRGKTVRRFRLQMATAVIDGRTRTLIVFLAPATERGTKLLTIENNVRRDEYFLYMPFLGKVKRIYGSRRNESFLGTQFRYEDLERLKVDEVEVHSDRRERVDGEVVRAIGTSPRRTSGYSRTEYLVAELDCSIIEIRHFKAGWGGPAKVISTPRSRMINVNDVMLPGWAVAKNLESGNETEVFFSSIEVNPGINPRLFEPSALERLGGIPGLPRSDRPVTRRKMVQ